MKDGGTVCGFCGSLQGTSVLYSFSDIFNERYSMIRCEQCGAIFLHPRPDASVLKRAYDDSYYGQQEKKFTFPGVEKVLDWFRAGRARKLMKYLQEGDAVLDLGCGNGNFLKSLLKRIKTKVYGIELEGRSADRARQVKGIKLKTGTLQQGDFSPQSLDAITLFHVFEHLTEPATTLNIIDQILKNDGILMISFPNIDSWQSRLFKGYWLHLDPPRHLFFFTPDDFISLMNKRGYQLLDENYFSLEQNPFGIIQSILNQVTSRRDLLFESLKGNREYMKDYPFWKIRLQKIFFLLSFPVFVLTNLFAAVCKKGATVEFIFRKTNLLHD